jgi:hypothetical protein
LITSVGTIEIADAALTFLLLEDWAECLPVWELSYIIEYLEMRGPQLTSVITRRHPNT